MKKWVSKLVEQLEIGVNRNAESSKGGAVEQAAKVPSLNEERASVIFFLDVLGKNIFELEKSTVRATREKIDSISKTLVQASTEKAVEDALFESRQFWGSYRVEEYAYVQKTFDDFRRIVLELVGQLGEDLSFEKKEDQLIRDSLGQLKEAVESNSIEALKSQSRQFIDQYVQMQAKKEKRRSKRMSSVKTNLTSVKKKLGEAQESLRVDHLTKALNRRTFEQLAEEQAAEYKISQTPVSVVLLDIDHFKKVNDTYGHPVGDFVLQQCVMLLTEEFKKDGHVCRIGGEEFAVLLPTQSMDQAMKRAETALWRIRGTELKTKEHTLKITVSMGISELQPDETVSDWVKRADVALYQSKKNGRNRCTQASPVLLKEQAAS